MAQDNLNLKFTDEMYATRKDVSNVLQTSLIDVIWSQIVAYRDKYKYITRLRGITRLPYKVVYTSATLQKMTDCERKIEQCLNEFSNYSGSGEEKQKLKNLLINKNVSKLAARYQIRVTSDRAIELFNGTANDISEKEFNIVNYFTALKDIAVHNGDSINEETLSIYYSQLNYNALGYSTYREKDLSINRSLFGVKEYTSAPVTMIETMMHNLIDFVNNSDQSLLVKLAALYYSIYLIKPFETLNEEFALLATKFYLISWKNNESAMYLPLEDLLAKPQDRFKQLMSEAQKDADLTYIVMYLAEQITSICDNFLDTIRNYNFDLSSTQYRNNGELQPKVEEQIQAKEETIPDFVEEVVEEPINAKAEIKEEPKIEQKPVEEKVEQPIHIEEKRVEVITQPVSKPEPVVEKVIEKPAVNVEQATFTISKEVLQLSERDAQKYEQYLLETEPFMKKSQAHFYARHCAIGRYYTIQQYKRSVGCVYETARTSMDNLVSLGYYKKEQIKNKFVYTPIKKEN